jgi:hypothetical protein
MAGKQKYFAMCGLSMTALAMLALTILIAAAATQAAGQEVNHGPAGNVSLGDWGSTDVEMQVTPQGATLEFDCARGTILEPLVLDEKGGFRAHGTFQTEGGPVRKDAPPGATAVYSGHVDGDTMRLQFVLSGNEQAEGPFTLARGNHGHLRKCK